MFQLLMNREQMGLWPENHCHVAALALVLFVASKTLCYQKTVTTPRWRNGSCRQRYVLPSNLDPNSSFTCKNCVGGRPFQTVAACHFVCGSQIIHNQKLLDKEVLLLKNVTCTFKSQHTVTLACLHSSVTIASLIYLFHCDSTQLQAIATLVDILHDRSHTITMK